MIGRKRGCLFSVASTVGVFGFLALGFVHSALAETVEIAPGVQVTKRTYAVPINEQPFFGFADKTASQREADDKFVQALLQAVGTREKAVDETTKRGWRALAAGKAAEAALRFNQAYLVAPEQSRVYHGLAVIAQTRFNDIDFAEELFRIAQKQPNPLKILNADYGRVLLIAKRPKDAQPVLEQAVKDTPEAGDAWTDLGLARLRNHNPGGACLAADQADKLGHAVHANTSIRWIWREAKCSGH
jgi:predicted Zn-dependent protease